MDTVLPDGLLVVGAVPPPDGVRALLAELAEAGHTVRWASRGDARVEGASEAHQLRTRLPGRHPRKLLVALAGALAPARQRLRLAAKFDPWFRGAVRGSSLVVATDGAAEATLPIARHFLPGVATARPSEAVPALQELLAATRARRALDAAAAEGRRVLDELGITGRTDADVVAVAGGVFAAADGALEAGDDARAAELAALALDLLFHRELHSDALASPLVDDTARYLAPLRESAVGRLLTTPSGAPLRPGAARGGVTAVGVCPGPFGSFYRPVAHALAAVPGATVTVRDLRAALPGLSNLGMQASFVRSRLDHARGRPVAGYDKAVELLTADDVLFVDWADKGALLASLLAPPTTRLVLRVHSVDLLRPWLHLVDWSRVDALICVSETMAGFARDLLGDRLAQVELRVLPPLVDPQRFDTAKTADAGKTICMVGWAQRVKDPLWALEVLARLVADDDQWRLLLIGADFPARLPASGVRHAAEFRQRAMADDIRERISYVGFTHDLPAHLAGAGWVLCASRREAFPVGLAECLLSGAAPVIRDWPMMAGRGGARALYPASWVVDTVDEAVQRFRSVSAAGAVATEGAQARETAVRLLDPELAGWRHQALILGDDRYLAAMEHHPDDAALGRFVAELLARPAADPALLRRCVALTRRIGLMSSEAPLLERLSALGLDPEAGRAAARLRARLRETSEGWWPTVADSPVTAPVAGRILHVLKVSRPQRQSGYSLRGWYTLHEQRNLGLDAIGVTALDFPDGESAAADGVEYRLEDVDGVPHYRLLRPAAPEGEQPDAYLQAWAEALAPLVAQLRPEVIHVHSGHRGFDSALVALAVGRAARVPVVYEVRGFFESLWTSDRSIAERGETFERRRATEARCMRAADAVVTLSESMREEIIARGVRAEAVAVVPNAVAPDAFPQRPRNEELARRLGLDGRFVFGYVSNLDHPREGHELLIRAALALRERGVAATALLVGDGRRRPELEALAAELGVADAVLFTGRIPHREVQDYYRLCDVFVVPRIDERAARLVTPLKPYEAMALGVPLLVSDLPALKEVVGKGSRGAIFTAGSATALADALDDARLDPGAAARRAAAARQWVRSQRTWRHNAEAYRALYSNLTPGANPGHANARIPARPDAMRPGV